MKTSILNMAIDLGVRQGARRAFRVTLLDRSRQFPDDEVVKKIWVETPKAVNIITVLRRDEEKRTLLLSLPPDTPEGLRQRFLQKLEDEILGNTK